MTVTEPDATDTTPVEMITCTIDGVEVSVPKGTLIIRAAELVGTEVPRFCDHPLLEPVAACRQCLVDIPDAGNGRGFPKPQPACAVACEPGMVVATQVTSETADKAQRAQIEFLLANHPLDCPVCDKGGECPLQNQAMSHGDSESRFTESKRHFAKPVPLSENILIDRERCVLCQRCTRFAAQIPGEPLIHLLERGAKQQIGIADDEPFDSYFAGNTIQICPVGALTSADYRFRSRPFDLVSVPSVAEHDACGSAIRVDYRRGKVMRRLAGDEPEVNEEWITDKDRFAFTWSRQEDRLTTPLVRNTETGELEPTSWPAAVAAAAAGLKAAGDSVGVITGGRLTLEDAYAYSKFARTVLGTNSIDFRSRAASAEEAEFLAAHVAGTPVKVTFAALENAKSITLVGLEPQDEAGALFLRLRKAAKKGVKIFAIASHLTHGLERLDAELIQTVPGKEAEALAAVQLGAGDVLLVGERLGQVAGGLTAAVAAAANADLVWVPRRAGDRGAVDAGCLPGLLPGGRPVGDAAARADLAAAWGVDSLPSAAGLDVNAQLTSDLSALVIAGAEARDLPADLPEHAFIVSLEVRRSGVAEAADVVLPVAPPAEKSGSFVNFEGRRRRFDTVLDVAGSLPDVRVLAALASELGKDLGFIDIAGAARDLDELGAWDGARASMAKPAAAKAGRATKNAVTLSTWHQLIDDGVLQAGADTYLATARAAVLRASASTLADAGLEPGDIASLSTPAGEVHFEVEEADLPDKVVWVPANNGVHVRSVLGVGYAGTATLAVASKAGDAA